MEQRPYSIFSDGQKKRIVIFASLTGFISPLSANIYLPALDTLAKAMNVSNTLINLTVTSYMIFQAIAPTFVGNFSDNAGRRPAYTFCFVVCIAANVGLALQSSYAALMVLRCVQSAGTSGTVALASGTIADIVTSAERGTYIGYSQMGAVLGPSLSPIIGGLLTQFVGWRWIFWFLVIFAACVFSIFLVFFPETCRNIVEDGSKVPPKWDRPLRQLVSSAKEEEPVGHSALCIPNPLPTVRIIFTMQGFFTLFIIGLLYSAFYAVTTTMALVYKEKYNFNDIQVSLMFIPIGAGSAISTFTTGKLLNRNYRKHAKLNGFPLERNRQHDMSNFPIEKARLEIATPFILIGSLALIAYGWTVDYQVHLAAPIVFLFVTGYTFIAGYSSMAILMVDLNSEKAATATAANNLVRCLLGAGASAIVVPMVEKIGMGWTCTFFALLWATFSVPAIFIIRKYGMKWRDR